MMDESKPANLLSGMAGVEGRVTGRSPGVRDPL